MAAPVVLILSIVVFCLFSSAVDAEYASVVRGYVDGAYRISHKEDVDVLAWGNFTNAINSTGWSVLDLETNKGVDDMTQAYAAGLLEGHLTRKLVVMQWHNTVTGYCEKPYSAYCQRLKTFLETNLNWMYQQISLNPKDTYWHQVATQLAQINGISDGVKGIQGRPRFHIDDVFGFYLMHIMVGDTEDLEAALHKESRHHVTGSGSCSALIKLLPGFKDLYASHDTWSGFQGMLRILKRYKLHLRQTSDPFSTLLPGNEVSFSGYPGTIWSGDDFYTINSGLVSIETTIGNNNASLWSYVKPTGCVLENFRVTAANRLATKISEWGEVFSRYNSGTYNNQWMVVDYNKFTPGRRPPSKGLLLVLEQIPGTIKSADKTQQLVNDGYWASFNIPYFPEIFTKGGNEALVKKYGDWFTHENSPRNKIFERDQHKVVDMPSMLKLMRYNNFQQDPLSRCNCTPPYSGENAISARSDLNPKNGTYPFGALSHRLHGGTDCKVTTSRLVRSLSFVAVSGPTWDQQPPFKWSTSDFRFDTPHIGHPDSFQFTPILMDWTDSLYLRPAVSGPELMYNVADDDKL